MDSQFAVLFDLDGTLTDSKPGILGCLRKALDELHINYDGPLDHFVGPPVEEWAVEILPNGTDAARAHLCDTYRGLYDREGWSKNSVFPGIPEMLAALCQQGATLYVCTSKQERFAQRIVGKFGLDKYFKGVYGDKPECDHSKVALMARLLKQENLPASCAVMIGDRRFDIAAANANGVRAVGVTWGYGTAEELTQAGAETLCATPDEVIDAVFASEKC